MAFAIFVWLAMCLLTAVLAAKKRRNPFGWFLLALLCWPLAIVALLILGQAPQSDARLARYSERKCPHCAEIIKWEAHVCRYCGRDVPELPAYRDV